VSALPNGTHWSFQSYDPKVYEVLSGVPLVTEPATIGMDFKEAYRQPVADLVNGDLFESINFLEVSLDDVKLLEAFDGFVIVTVSKTFPLAGTNLTQYLDQDWLYVSDNW